MPLMSISVLSQLEETSDSICRSFVTVGYPTLLILVKLWSICSTWVLIPLSFVSSFSWKRSREEGAPIKGDTGVLETGADSFLHWVAFSANEEWICSARKPLRCWIS